MGYKNLLVILIVLAGCTSVSSGQKRVYEQGYRTGVKEQMRTVAGKFKDGDFPYYHWASPIVQEVHVPGHVANSIFIPEHTELVIIKPGEWARNPVYPIQSQEEIHESTEQIVDRDVSDITCLPQRSGRAGNHQPERKARDPAPGVGAAK